MTFVENKGGKEIKAKAIFYNREAYLCHRLQSSEEKRNNRWLRIAAGGSVLFSPFFYLSWTVYILSLFSRTIHTVLDEVYNRSACFLFFFLYIHISVTRSAILKPTGVNMKKGETSTRKRYLLQ